MTDFSDNKEQERLQSYLNIHLKKDKQSLSIAEQIDELHKRDRNKWIQLAVNIAAILFFGYSFYFDITQLSQTFFIIIIIVFALNVGLIFYQKKQISELIDYLKWKGRHEN
jgi:Mg2+/citrate symporter